MKTVTVTIDGTKVEAAAGSTILAAAEQAGIFIPTLCYCRDLEPRASCGLCMVEVEGQTDLVPSCATEITGGMKIQTTTSSVHKARRTCIELLLSDHLGDCLAPCVTACPAGIDIPGFIFQLSCNDNRRALELIKQKIPFAGVLGRICQRPCEDACRRQLAEAPVAICDLKRYVADTEEEFIPEKASATGKKIAIVGAGPAGLTAAYYLLLMGHMCSLFDANEKPGGMLQYAIPCFNLPRSLVDAEVETINKLGARTHPNTLLGRDISLDYLRREFDAVFLALGAQEPLRMHLENEGIEGVTTALSVLNNQSRGQDYTIGKKVIIIGGGGAAMDAARVARRKGAADVRIYCLEKKHEMPAHQRAVDAAEAEGITILNEWGIKHIIARSGRVAGVELKRCITVFDSNGNFNPCYDESGTVSDDCETLIVAAGQSPDLSCLEGTRGADVLLGVDMKQGMQPVIKTDRHTMQTGMADVFAGGDCVSSAGTVVSAIASGRRAAISIDQFVRGQPVTGDPVYYNNSLSERSEVLEKIMKLFPKVPRIKMRELNPDRRMVHFDEVEQGFTAQEAGAEAKRCIQCGCRGVHECKLRTNATQLFADGTTFHGRTCDYETDESLPKIIYEAHKCIKCRLCVRIAEELFGTRVMRVAGRGFDLQVKPAEAREPLSSALLTRMVENCPVGALTFKKNCGI
jgi:NADPH-dependent glutamate synthase beta subunit-like oxidoreductase/ferredoxin